MENKTVVSSGQIFTLLFVSRVGIAVLSSTQITGGGNVWNIFIPLLITFALNFLFLIPIIIINRQIRNEESSYIHNVASLKTVSLIYGLFFIFDIVRDLLYFSDFIIELAGNKINGLIIILILMLAVLYGAIRGIEAISRFSAVSFIAIILSTVMIFAFLIQTYSSDNLLPLSYVSNKVSVNGTIRILSQTNELAALFILCQFTKDKFSRNAFMWNVFTNLFLMIMLILISGSLGEYLIGISFPFYHIIDGAGTLQRFNPFFIGVCISLLFAGLTMKLFIIDCCIKSIVIKQKIKTKTTVFITALIYIAFIEFYYHRNIRNIIFDINIWFILNIILSFAIPLIFVYVCALKKRKSKSRKKLAKATALILVFAITVPIFSGCSGSNQLNQRLIVQGIGIDKYDSGYKMTLIVLNTESELQEDAVSLIYTEGNSIEEAVSSLEDRSGKDILLSQCLFIMLNKESARVCNDSLSYFRHNNDIMKTVNIMTAEYSSENVITYAIEKLGYHSEDINILSDSRAVKQPSVHFSLFDYATDLNNNLNDMLMPYISIDKELKSLTVNGSCLVSFRNGTAEFLSSDESLGALIINKNAVNYTSTENGITYKINDISTNVIPKISNEKLHFDFDIDITLNKSIDKNTSNKIRDHLCETVNLTLYKCIRKNGCDIFSLNKYIRTIDPNYYLSIEDWDKKLKNSDYKINISLV